MKSKFIFPAKQLAGRPRISSLDFPAQLVGEDGTISRDIVGDGIHPTEAGRAIGGKALPARENPAMSHNSRILAAPAKFHPLRRASSLLAAVVLGLAANANAADFDGTWRIDLVRTGGVTLQTYLVLHQQGTSLGGKIIINDAVDLALRRPQVDGSNAVFSCDWNTEYHLRLDGDILRVTLVYGGSSREEATAKRVPEAEALPPAGLPPPPLGDVPDNGLASTPPMGWSSWNHFGGSVDDKIVRETADAMVNSGMAAAGYVYVNIDDTWEGGRDAQGNLFSNQKFPDMKALADYVHGRGLKLGIYSSPGPKTCGGYEGSYGHEEQDAKTFADWGIDFLKHDWCSAARVYKDADVRAVYQKMGVALADCGRPIVYSLCEYGMGNVGTWGTNVGANLWRTTGDIQDNWRSMSGIGFYQGRQARYAGPGHWNDPDMLEVGNGGMSSTEYKTHFSLWCMLAAPLMAGNDLRSMSVETREILTNREVIAVDQDVLGKEGDRLLSRNSIEVWAKPLHDGSRAIGVFNRSEAANAARVSWSEFGLAVKPSALRDLWEHKDLAQHPMVGKARSLRTA
jgi:alpha-galactosidase